jgi:hypothetical protein
VYCDCGAATAVCDRKLDRLGPDGRNILTGHLVEQGTALVRYQLASCLCTVRVGRMLAKEPT